MLTRISHMTIRNEARNDWKNTFKSIMYVFVSMCNRWGDELKLNTYM